MVVPVFRQECPNYLSMDMNNGSLRSQLKSILDAIERLEEHVSPSAGEDTRIIIGNIHQQLKRVMETATTDVLTGLLNRRGWEEAVREFYEKRRKYDYVSCMLIDFRYLKQYNDSFGHKQGDKALETLGDIIRNSKRWHDIAANVGGDEFYLILLNTDTEGALNLARRIAEKIKETEIPRFEHILAEESEEYPLRTYRKIAVDMGIATMHTEEINIDKYFEYADRAMYNAKRNAKQSGTIVSTISIYTEK